MGIVAGLLAVLLGAALGIALLVGISLGVVYALMWILTGLFGLPYVAASSTLFATLTVFVILGAIGQILQAENKGAGFFMAIISLLLSPLTYAASFRAHAEWTGADMSGDARYLPGEYWQFVTDGAGWVSAQVSSVVPALDGVFQAIDDSPLLTQIIASTVTGVVLLIGQQMFKRRPRAA